MAYRQDFYLNGEQDEINQQQQQKNTLHTNLIQINSISENKQKEIV